MTKDFNVMLDYYIECEQENARLITEEILFSNKDKLPENVDDCVHGLPERGREDKHHPCGELHCGLKSDMWECQRWKEVLKPIFQNASSINIDKFLALYFYLHCSAYERWEDSFNYDCIGCGLVSSKLIADFTAKAHPGIDSYTKNLFEALSFLAQRVLHQSLIENGMIANDPLEMRHHAKRYLELSDEASKKLKNVFSSPDPELKDFAENLDDFITQSVKHHECLVKTTEYMDYCQKDRNRFYTEYPSFRPQLIECISYLEKYENNKAAGKVKFPDFESASEMRGHLVTLDRFAAQRGNPRLRIDQIDGQLMVGFYLDVSGFQWKEDSEKVEAPEKGTAAGKNNFPTPISSNEPAKADQTELKALSIFDKLRKKLNVDHGIGSFPILAASNDPAPDILETNIGSKHFENILIEFPTLVVNKLPFQKFDPNDPVFPLKLKPKLLHCRIGVGIINFEIEKPDDRNKTKFTVSDFQVIKNMICPHAARYEMAFDNKIDPDDTPEKVASKAEYPTTSWGRVPELAEKIFEEYHKLIDQFYQDELKGFRPKTEHPENDIAVLSEPDRWMEPSQTWFTSIRFYNITDEHGNAIDSKNLAANPEWPGIWSYHRADKASVDDWIGISLDDINIKNLAQVRGHKSDFFGLTENYAIIFMRDDPEFIVLQYIETTKWIILIRTLILYCLAESDKPLENLKATINMISDVFPVIDDVLDDAKLDDFEHKVYNMHLDVQKFGALALTALDHVNSATVSQYADHALLLRKAFSSLSMPELTNDLQIKIQNLTSGQQAMTAVIQRIQNQRTKKREDQERKRLNLMNVLLVLLGAIQCVMVFDVIYEIWTGNTKGTEKELFINLISIAVIAILFYLANRKKLNNYFRKYRSWPLIGLIIDFFRNG